MLSSNYRFVLVSLLMERASSSKHSINIVDFLQLDSEIQHQLICTIIHFYFVSLADSVFTGTIHINDTAYSHQTPVYYQKLA